MIECSFCSSAARYIEYENSVWPPTVFFCEACCFLVVRNKQLWGGGMYLANIRSPRGQKLLGQYFKDRLEGKALLVAEKLWRG